MQNAAAQAYGQTARTTASPRDVEADLLMKAAYKLQWVRENWERSGEDLDAALTFNRRLWTVLSASATDATNPLPREVKQNIGSLALFIFNRTIAVQTERRPEQLDSLVSINRELAAGLRGAA